MLQKIKVVITGAAGQIGYALLFRIASGQMFGPNTMITLNLLELEASLPALQGIAMELADCAFPLLQQINISSDVNVAMQDVNWALLIGAAPRKAGMERADLLAMNAKIFAVQGQALNKHAAPDAKILVVGNPCNTNCLITKHHAPQLKAANFFAMTMLDELRARSYLALKAQVNVSAISHMNIWGNHSSTQFPDFYHAQINGRLAPEVIQDLPWLQHNFIPWVQQRGAAVIKARGASSAASAANAIVQTVYNIIHDTPNNDTYSLGVCATGEYGVDPGLIYSFPCRTVAGQVQVVSGLSHDVVAQQQLELTLAELQQEQAAVAASGLLA